MAITGNLYKKMYGHRPVVPAVDPTPDSPTGDGMGSGNRAGVPGVPDAQTAQTGMPQIGGGAGVGDTGVGAGGQSTDIDDLYQQRLTLAENLAAEQRRISQEAANYKREALSDQLDDQRRQYQQGLQVMSEQSYNRGSQLLNQLANRGLATSGLLQLGDVQNKMAQGQGMSQLAYQDRTNREDINQAQRQTESTLAQQLRQAGLDKAQTEMGASEQLYGRQMQQEQMQREELMFLKDRGLADLGSFEESGLSEEEFKAIQSTIMNMTDTDKLTDFLMRNSLSQGEDESLAGMIDTAEGKAGLGSSDVEFNDPGFFAKQFGAGFIGQTVDPNKVDDAYMNKLVEDNQLTLSNGVPIEIRDAIYIKDIAQGGSRIALDNEKASESLKNNYSDFDNYDSITVNLFSDEYGSTRSKPFGVEKPNGDTEWFGTWNEASDFYDEKSKSWQ
jgi:hypothetical protein